MLVKNSDNAELTIKVQEFIRVQKLFSNFFSKIIGSNNFTDELQRRFMLARNFILGQQIKLKNIGNHPIIHIICYTLSFMSPTSSTASFYLHLSDTGLDSDEISYNGNSVYHKIYTNYVSESLRSRTLNAIKTMHRTH